ncbi:MAG TPA: NAD(P)H-dependent glycerol-3-phosphate dehydrogenase [Gaiellaceae bacterium]
MRAVVVGGGSWGTGFSRFLADRGVDVTLATHHAEDAEAIRETGWNPRFLTQVDLSDVHATTIAEAPVEDTDLIVVAVPSRAFREVVGALPGSVPLLSLTKGLDPETGARLSTIVTGRTVAVLSGPNFADEVAAGLPGATVIASEDAAFARSLQESLNSTVFRIYLNDDLIGVELCAAAKNVIALAAGACDGLQAGDNAKAAIITRGLAEMARLGASDGADADTFYGLAGMGDLVATCWHPAGRNRHAGELIARGRSPEQAAAEIGQVVEGLTTAPVLRDFARRKGVELPITESVCSVLEGRSLAELAAGLMGRKPTDE